MTHDTEIQEHIDRIEELIDQLDARGLSDKEVDQRHEEGHQHLTAARRLIADGTGTVIERK